MQLLESNIRRNISIDVSCYERASAASELKSLQYNGKKLSMSGPARPGLKYKPLRAYISATT